MRLGTPLRGAYKCSVIPGERVWGGAGDREPRERRASHEVRGCLGTSRGGFGKHEVFGGEAEGRGAAATVAAGASPEGPARGAEGRGAAVNLGVPLDLPGERSRLARSDHAALSERPAGEAAAEEAAAEEGAAGEATSGIA